MFQVCDPRWDGLEGRKATFTGAKRSRDVRHRVADCLNKAAWWAPESRCWRFTWRRPLRSNHLIIISPRIKLCSARARTCTAIIVEGGGRRRWRRRGRSTPSVLLPASKTRRRGSVFDSKTRDSFGMKWRPINRESMLGGDEARWTGYPGLVEKVIYRLWIRNGRGIFGGGNEEVFGELELRGEYVRECVLNIVDIR